MCLGMKCTMGKVDIVPLIPPCFPVGDPWSTNFMKSSNKTSVTRMLKRGCRIELNIGGSLTLICILYATNTHCQVVHVYAHMDTNYYTALLQPNVYPFQTYILQYLPGLNLQQLENSFSPCKQNLRGYLTFQFHFILTALLKCRVLHFLKIDPICQTLYSG